MSCRQSISARSRRPPAACTTWSSTNFPTRGTLASSRATPSRVASRAPGLTGAPYFLRRFDDQAQFGRLRLTRDLITVHGARKAALRRQTELVERQHFSCLVYFSLQRVLEIGRASCR